MNGKTRARGSAADCFAVFILGLWTEGCGITWVGGATANFFEGGANKRDRKDQPVEVATTENLETRCDNVWQKQWASMVGQIARKRMVGSRSQVAGAVKQVFWAG